MTQQEEAKPKPSEVTIEQMDAFQKRMQKKREEEQQQEELERRRLAPDYEARRRG